MITSNLKKGSDQYLTENCDRIIGELVKEKEHLFKAYNYFNGVRDHYQYEHLEKNEGVGNPTSIGFTPLVRKHVEAIVGEYLTTDPKPRISCKDKKTLSNIFRDKELAVAQKIKQWLSQYLENAIYSAIFTGGQEQNGQQQQIVDQEIQREMTEIEDMVNRNFISNYEIAAQNICNYVLQDRRIDFKNKLEQLFLNMLISGESYYQVVKSHNGTNFRLELCDPMNTWVDKDPKSRYMKNGHKSVIRKWMTEEEIIIKYGDYLTESDIKELSRYKMHFSENSNFLLITGQESRCGSIKNPGIMHGVGAHPEAVDYMFERQWDLIPVYEVEWIDYKKQDGKYIGVRYHVTRIHSDIYILDGEDEDMPRDIDEQNEARLSVNGIWYTNGHGAPYSLMLATADQQD